MVNPLDPNPAYVGIPTFFRAPLARAGELSPGMFAVMGIPHDSTSGSRQGTRYGPRGIREGSLDVHAVRSGHLEHGVVDVSRGVWLRRTNDRVIVDVGDVDVYPNDLVRSSESMRNSARAIAKAGATPILLGGDHYMTYPLFRGWAEGMGARGKRTFGYIQYDNHLDFSDDNRIWGKLWHGSQARRISELPFVRPRNLVWIGPAGSHSKEQADWITANGATLFHPGHIREQGIAEVTRRAIQLASESTDGIYVSVDIDVVLGAASPGTGAIVVDGISPAELLTSIRLLAESGLVRAMDVAEVAPPLDPTDRTTRLAAEVVLEFASPALFVREDFVLVAPA